MPKAKPTGPTIDVVLDEFLDARRSQLPPGALRDCEDAVELLRGSLNGYAYDSLGADEQRRWQEAFDNGDEDAFCRLFGPEKLIAQVDEFFGYFMVRRVVADRAFLYTAGSIVADLARWLGERGYVDPDEVEAAAERAEVAARELPRADRLADLLYETARSGGPIDTSMLAEEDYVEDYLEITRVEPGSLWSAGTSVPCRVPRKRPSSRRLAGPSMSCSHELPSAGGSWKLATSTRPEQPIGYHR